jgi:hypothetical protein
MIVNQPLIDSRLGNAAMIKTAMARFKELSWATSTPRGWMFSMLEIFWTKSFSPWISMVAVWSTLKSSVSVRYSLTVLNGKETLSAIVSLKMLKLADHARVHMGLCIKSSLIQKLLTNNSLLMTSRIVSGTGRTHQLSSCMTCMTSILMDSLPAMKLPDYTNISA